MRAIYSILIAFFISGCGSVEIDLSGDGGSIEDPVCDSGPVFEMIYPKILTWASPDCTGDFARGILSGEYPCAQWSTGDIYCIDFDQPIDKIYYHNANNGGKCEEWTLYPEQWYIWKFCGNQPLP